MNEGHAALLALELLRDSKVSVAEMRDGESPYDLHSVRARCDFTRHTPVGAGRDEFDSMNSSTAYSASIDNCHVTFPYCNSCISASSRGLHEIATLAVPVLRWFASHGATVATENATLRKAVVASRWPNRPKRRGHLCHHHTRTPATNRCSSTGSDSARRRSAVPANERSHT